MSRPFDLTGRVAVVTGGNGGIGLGIAIALGEAGATVAIWARDAAKSDVALSTLRDKGIAAVAVGCDIAEEAQVVAAVASTLEQTGNLDVLVANAADVGGSTEVVDLELGDWDRLIRTSLTGTFLCFREAARSMIARGVGGALIGVSSEAATEAAPRKAPYAAAKAGIGGLVRSLAVELAPHRIRCNVLVPGWTENHRIQQSTSSVELLMETRSAIPAGRWGTPADLGIAAVYLADPTLAYHTGAQLVVDGGYSIIPPYLAARAAREAQAASDA